MAGGVSAAGASAGADLLDRYTAAAISGARTDAADVAAEFALSAPDPSAAVRTLVTDLLAPAQEEIGERWLQLRCSVGEEHAATFVTSSILSSFAVGTEPAPTRGTWVMACAEGEWHDLPARMACELLIAEGWRVVHLGTSTPAPQLRSYLAGIDADVVGVSASIATSLPGAARSIDVARRLGFCVIAGGRAFGTDRQRAHALGAHGWFPGPAVGVDPAEHCWDDPVPVGAALDPEAPAAALEQRRDQVVRDATEWIAVNHDRRVLASPSWLETVVAELDHAVGTLVAALMCDDPRIVAEHRQWLARFGDGAAEVRALGSTVYHSLAAVLPPHSMPALRILERADPSGVPPSSGAPPAP